MKNRRVGFLLAAHAGAAVAGIAMVAPRPSSHFIEAVAAALALSQGCLLGTWAAFAGRPTPWRLAGTTVALVVGSIILHPNPHGRGDPSYAFIVLVQVLGTSVPLLAARFVGLEVARSLPDGSAPTVYRFQFSLRAMLEWTAAAAILLGMVPLLSDEFRDLFLRGDWQTNNWKAVNWPTLGLFAIDGLVAMAALWVTLGVQRTAVRLAVLAASGVGLAIFLASMRPPASWVVAFPLLVAALLLASLWVFRGLGYRLVWRRSLRL